jgi:UDP-N-acetylglucosamine--N-acetylmuramyl-(pentapeptide) pyrophosphoryl-undecaprenol N-acetylglucosamine transferase
VDLVRVLIAGGGTGGHVIPALAIARELRDAHGAEVRFVGTARGLETRLVPEAGFPLELIRVGQLKNVSVVTKLRTMADLPLGVMRCVGVVRSFKPDVVVGVGGYASGPAMMAAILLRVPTLAFEPNAVPGLANRMVGKWVTAAAVNFDGTRSFFRGAKVTGIPVRREFFEVGAKTTGTARRLLVFGGSQGARVLNEVLPKIAARLLEAIPGLEIVHQTGGRHEVSTKVLYERAGLAAEVRLRVQPYLDDMVGEFAQADLMLCRSGASTMAELAAAGKASLLVPFPQAADDHQRKNADVFVAAEAAELIVESELTEDRLLSALRGMLLDGDWLVAMGERARGLAHPNAVEEIGEMVVGISR